MKKLTLILMAIALSWWLAYASQAAEVTLTWNEVEGCSYEVHYGPASRQYDNKQAVTDTTCTLDITPGIYYFSVTAKLIDCKYTICTSEYSDEVSLMLSDKPEIATIALSVK